MRLSTTGLQRLGRALMLPIAVLPIAGLLLRLGQPDLLDIAFVSAAGDAIFSHLGLRKSDVFFFPFSFGPFLGFWTAFEAAARDGYLVLPGGGLTSTARLRFLLEHRATVICCTPASTGSGASTIHSAKPWLPANAGGGSSSLRSGLPL